MLVLRRKPGLFSMLLDYLVRSFRPGIGQRHKRLGGRKRRDVPHLNVTDGHAHARAILGF